MKQKKCKICWWPRNHNNSLNAMCKECTYKKSASNSKQTRIRQVSDKKKVRLKETWWEVKTFEQVYKERKNCIICNKFVSEPKTWCFAHILNKKDYPHLRNFTNNIAFVCSIDCHHVVDSRITWSNKKDIEQQILDWKVIIIW